MEGQKKSYIAEKIAPLMPSMRENKRYVSFEIISDGKISDFNTVSKSVWASCLDLLGTYGCAKAGIYMVEDRWDSGSQTGIISVDVKYVNHLKSALLMMQKIDGHDVIFRSLKTSGMINKAS